MTMPTSYGVRAWSEWLEKRPRSLKHCKEEPNRVWETPLIVQSYRELFTIVSFLHVMNKKQHMLFRGQVSHDRPVPTLFRSSWRNPDGHKFNLDGDRQYYFRTLSTVSERISDVLLNPLSVPRYRPFELTSHRTSIAPWSVVQHYELWPTPLLDLTASLRVAASFALGLAASRHADEAERFRECDREVGMLYAFAAPEIMSDVMRLPNDVKMVALRLSAVCPHDAKRPHLQEGYLVGPPRLDEKDLDGGVEESPAMEWLSAVFHLENADGRFFDREFPRHTQAALLPERTADPLLRRFREAIAYRLDAATQQCRLDPAPGGE